MNPRFPATQPRLKVVYRLLAEIKPDPRNPRRHNRHQIRKLAKIIRELGCNSPLLLDRYDNLLAGHARYEACKSLGMTEVPTIQLDHLDEHQARAFMLADNRLAELSAWDEALLVEHLKELSEVLDFDVELTGFEMGEIDLRIEGLDDAGQPDAADAIPESPLGMAPITRPGDMFLLGDHRVLCANVMEGISLPALMDDKLAKMAFIDPPYNIPIAGNVSGFGRNHHREFMMGSGEMSPPQFVAFLSEACARVSRYTVNGSIQFYCIDWRHLVELHEAGRKAGLSLLNICVWAKQSAGMGSFYRSQYELVFVFRNGRERHRNNIQLGRFGRDRSNLWSYPGAVGLRGHSTAVPWQGSGPAPT